MKKDFYITKMWDVRYKKNDYRFSCNEMAIFCRSIGLQEEYCDREFWIDVVNFGNEAGIFDTAPTYHLMALHKDELA